MYQDKLNTLFWTDPQLDLIIHRLSKCPKSQEGKFLREILTCIGKPRKIPVE